MGGSEERDMIIEANHLACDLERLLNQKQFAALKNTLERFHVSSRCYSMFEIREESSCLIYEEGLWSVFFAERNMRTNEKRTEDPEEACRFLLYAMADSREEYEQMVHYFEREISKQTSGRKTSTDFYSTVRDALKKYASSVAL